MVCAPCLARLRRPRLPGCPRCAHPLGTGAVAGSDCLACRAWPDVLLSARAAVVLEPPADALVHALKYDGWRGLAATLARRMAGAGPPATGGNVPELGSRRPDEDGIDLDPVLVPVPTTPGRRRKRGYDQAVLLAGELAVAWNLPVAEPLCRTVETPSQISLHPSQRRANVKGVFALREETSGASVQDRIVILVDDVLTTGATASAAARALEPASVRGVTLVAFARALPEQRRARSRP